MQRSVRHTRSLRRSVPLAGAAAGIMLLAACGSDSGDTSSAAATSSGPLAGICPSTVKIQSSWYPQPSKGALYQLVGPNGTINTNNGTYSGKVGGVTVSVLAGGPFLGNQSVMARMYQDSSILLGEVSTDDAIEVSQKQPVIAVVATLQKSPKAIVYDPATYPGLKSIADVEKTGATVLKAGEDASSDLLVANGSLKSGQLDYSYDGSPGRFITADGKDMIIDYADATTYRFEHLKQWGKPLSSLPLADGGYTTYENSLSVTPANRTKYDSCLKALVPMIQKAVVGYTTDPGPVNTAMEKYATEAKSPTTLTPAQDAYSVTFMKDHGVLAAGTDGVVGSFDADRVNKLITDMAPVAKKQHITVKSGLAADALVTNAYLDTTVTMK
ncbi:hypothetical protein OG552_34765 [Streptomyces sp. NBC_01476]|uniref:hypothetical protein n=1 Tax=Streptomyces sp. NBC_01476 TaxID=2903881 RepID=UPI002E35FB13|nr:hypothetical protein [Streptomyces sp. NBC_01476]